MVISQKQTNGQTINISTISPQKAGEACKGKKNENQGIVQEILTQPANKPVFIDLFNFSRDPENTILNISACYRFDGTFENDRNAVRFVEYARLAITTEHARRTVDALTRLLDYYPQKPEPPKEEKTRAKKNISLS